MIRNHTVGRPDDVLQRLPRVIPGMLFLWALIFALAKFVPNAGAVMCGAAAIYALRGARQTLEAFSVLAFLILLGETGSAAVRWLVVLAGFGRMVWDTFFNEEPLPRIFWPLTIFSGTVLFLALLASYLPAVSALKVVSFWTGAATALTMFYRTRSQGAYWLDWYATLGLFIGMASTVVYATGGGYERTPFGFQGITSHPQTFGPVMALVAALFGGVLVYHNRNKWTIWAGGLLALGGIYLSAARTALLATILAFGMAVIIGQLKGLSWWPRVRRTLLHPVTMLVYVGILGLAVVQWSSIQTRITDFLIKDDVESGSIVSALQESRGGLMSVSIENFISEPITGIGFGVPSNRDRMDVTTGPLGIPTGASVEKGFMPTAVLEETGITGAVLVLVLIIMLVRPVWQAGHVLYLWIMFVALLVNLGEMIFFSVGGMGLFFWLLMAFVHAQSIHVLETRSHEYA